eukprot:FN607290.1.p1 GENE.FN607290.1~~FN607290.1.p1  ORF type:complete len:58 (+),score=8.67 FN607290.1:3-176(+)
MIDEFLEARNTSPKVDEGFKEEFDRSLLRNETILYEALRKRREELLRGTRRPLCSFD